MKKLNGLLWPCLRLLLAALLFFSCQLGNLTPGVAEESAAATAEDPAELAELGIAPQYPSGQITLDSNDPRGVYASGIDPAYLTIHQPASGQYVLEINLRPTGKRHYQTVMFSVYNTTSATGWNVNIGDSATNNGYGGDAGTQSRDAELQVYNNKLTVYSNQHGGTQVLHSAGSFLPTSGTLRVRYQIENNKLTYWKGSDSSPHTTITNSNLFALAGQSDSEGPVNYTIFAAFNRTIGSASRSGSGITNIYVYLSDPLPYNVVSAPSTYSVTLKHLKYRDGVWSWSKWKANTSFSGYQHFLNGRNASDWDEKESEHIFIAEVWKPSPAAVKNVVFLSAGQQGALIDRQDPPNILTGQPQDWHKKPDASGLEELNSWKYVTNKTIAIDSLSIGGQIISDYLYNGSGYFGMTPANTYLALVFDACFYYEMSAAKKNERVTDYLEWLFSKVDNNQYGNVDNFYLAGASRGGALVTRLGYTMKHDATWRARAGSAQIIVSAFDGVAHEGEGELFTTTTHVDNPLEWINGRFCFYSNLHNNLSYTSNLHIYQISGGADVIPLILNKHGFYLVNTGNTLKFKWVDRSHLDIGRSWHTDTCVDHLRWMATWLQ